MKIYLAFTFSFLSVLPVIGQTTAREIDRSLVKINKSLYASMYEVSNKQYKTFVDLVSRSGDESKLTVVRVDSTGWRDKKYYNEPYAVYYHQHKAYENYPVVNISYEAATLFCEWLSDQYNSSPDRKFKKVVFRLPSEQEWAAAAQAGDSSAIYPWRGKELKNKRGELMANFRRPQSDTETGVADNSDVTAPVRSYSKNTFGLYNMSGNVAEMTSTKTIIKGGSWKSWPDELAITARQPYNGAPHSHVGFRYFAEVIVQ